MSKFKPKDSTKTTPFGLIIKGLTMVERFSITTGLDLSPMSTEAMDITQAQEAIAMLGQDPITTMGMATTLKDITQTTIMVTRVLPITRLTIQVLEM